MAYINRPSSDVQSAFVNVAIASRRNRETAGLYDMSGKIVRETRLNVVDIGVSFFIISSGWRELLDCQRLYWHLLLARLT